MKKTTVGAKSVFTSCKANIANYQGAAYWGNYLLTLIAAGIAKACERPQHITRTIAIEPAAASGQVESLCADSYEKKKMTRLLHIRSWSDP